VEGMLKGSKPQR